MKEGRRRGGGGAASKSEGFNSERKAERGEMWILVRGGDVEVDISAKAENLESLQPKNWRSKCHQTRSLIQTRSEDILCCISHGWL